MRRLLLILGFILLVGLGSQRGTAASVLVLASPASSSPAERALQTAADFYGLTLDRLNIDDRDLLKQMEAAVRDPKFVAVAIAADAVNSPVSEQARVILQHGRAKIPVILLGINEETSAHSLRRWSAGVVSGCTRVDAPGAGLYQFGKDPEVNRELQGIRLQRPASTLFSLVVTKDGAAWHVIDAQAGGVEFPQVVRSDQEGHEVFFATAQSAAEIPATTDPYVMQAEFASLAPELIFLHYAAGPRGWQSPGAYANFTIDDLWLREPYGFVNYQELLSESQRHNFHTTIAFIPWNFDRSQDAVVSLFKQHPDRLSICIHGNDHLHQEFGPLASHPLDRQEFDVKQALARMERFSTLTGIPYDRFMVFPHSIAPAATLGLLKRYNYEGTANSLNVPSDAPAPTYPEFALRTVTLDFNNFPSLRRYAAETDIPQAQMAIDAFLGNPILFYAHEGFFSSGSHAFDRWADLVNTMEPTTQWASLGVISRHLYLEKLRDDGGYDIRTYSGAVDLENRTPHDVKYYVTKQEDFRMPVAVSVDGTPYPYARDGSELRLSLTIPAGQSRRIAVIYGGNNDFAATPIARNSLRVNVVRELSDFRDNGVSKSSLGRWFIRSYGANGRAWQVGTLLFLFGVILVTLQLRRTRRRRHALFPI